jgi:hypothetical protein
MRAANNNSQLVNNSIVLLLAWRASARDFLSRLLGLGGLQTSPAAAACWLQQLATRRLHVLLSNDRVGPRNALCRRQAVTVAMHRQRAASKSGVTSPEFGSRRVCGARAAACGHGNCSRGGGERRRAMSTASWFARLPALARSLSALTASACSRCASLPSPSWAWRSCGRTTRHRRWAATDDGALHSIVSTALLAWQSRAYPLRQGRIQSGGVAKRTGVIRMRGLRGPQWEWVRGQRRGGGSSGRWRQHQDPHGSHTQQPQAGCRPQRRHIKGCPQEVGQPLREGADERLPGRARVPAEPAASQIKRSASSCHFENGNMLFQYVHANARSETTAVVFSKLPIQHPVEHGGRLATGRSSSSSGSTGSWLCLPSPRRRERRETHGVTDTPAHPNSSKVQLEGRVVPQCVAAARHAAADLTNSLHSSSTLAARLVACGTRGASRVTPGQPCPDSRDRHPPLTRSRNVE